MVVLNILCSFDSDSSPCLLFAVEKDEESTGSDL